MNTLPIAAAFGLGAILGGWLMAYIYTAEIERTKLDNKFKQSYIDKLRDRLESIVYNQRGRE